jgi:hypothetical protein
MWHEREMRDFESITCSFSSNFFQIYRNHAGQPNVILSGNQHKWMILKFLLFVYLWSLPKKGFSEILDTACFFCSWALSNWFTKENSKQSSMTQLAQQVRGTEKKSKIRQSPWLIYAPFKFFSQFILI